MSSLFNNVLGKFFRVFGNYSTEETNALREAGIFYFDEEGYALNAETKKRVIYFDYMDVVPVRYSKWLEGQIIEVIEPEYMTHQIKDDIIEFTKKYTELRKKHGFKQIMNLIMESENNIDNQDFI